MYQSPRAVEWTRVAGGGRFGWHVDEHPESGCRGESGDERDRAAVAERVGDGAGDQAAGDVAAVAPEAVDADDGGARDGCDGVGHRGDQGRVDERGAEPEQHGRGGRGRQRAVAECEQRERGGLEQHAAGDQRLAPDAV